MSVASSAPPSEVAYLDHDVEDRAVMAEVPVTLRRAPKQPKQQTPQEAIDEFWAKFTTKTPGKGMLSSYDHHTFCKITWAPRKILLTRPL